MVSREKRGKEERIFWKKANTVCTVYEGEAEYFFKDSSSNIIQDDELSRLMSFFNVFIR
jgi:hypothetical protein